MNILFDDIIERDMDMLLAEEFASSKNFLALFANLVGEVFTIVEAIYVSKTDVALGESDIEIIVESKKVRRVS